MHLTILPEEVDGQTWDAKTSQDFGANGDDISYFFKFNAPINRNNFTVVPTCLITEAAANNYEWSGHLNGRRCPDICGFLVGFRLP